MNELRSAVSMAFIFSIEGRAEVSRPVEDMFKVFRGHPGTALTSELTLAEVLSGSESATVPSIRRAYLDLMVESKFLDLVPISRRILFQSAELKFVHRRDHGKKLRLPDAIHLATAIQRGCRYFVSADMGIRLPAGIEMIYPNIDGLGRLQRVFA